MSDWVGFLLLTLFAVATQGLFALFEMASVSFNRVRLQYYVSLGSKRAIWLKYLLERPSRLFGTTIIGINFALQIGSESSRRFYESIHLDPDWAPLSQVFLAVVIGELSPMFAGRRHPEQIAMALSPLMVLITRILSPVIWAFEAFSHLVHRLFGKMPESSLYLSREEVKVAFEDRGERENEFNTMVSRVFKIKSLRASEVMMPLSTVSMVPSSAFISDVKRQMADRYVPLLPIYHRTANNIVAIIYIRDLLNKPDQTLVIELSRPPWFITQDASVIQILDQFRRNNQSLAIVLNPLGQASGIITLDQILDQILGEEKLAESIEPRMYIERTLLGTMEVAEFNAQFQANLPYTSGDTLNDLIVEELGHPPVKGEVIHIGEYVFTVLEPTLRGVKSISVHSEE